MIVTAGCGFGLRCEIDVCVALAVEGEPCSGGCGPGVECGEEGLCVARRAMICDMEQDLP